MTAITVFMGICFIQSIRYRLETRRKMENKARRRTVLIQFLKATLLLPEIHCILQLYHLLFWPSFRGSFYNHWLLYCPLSLFSQPLVYFFSHLNCRSSSFYFSLALFLRDYRSERKQKRHREASSLSFHAFCP